MAIAIEISIPSDSGNPGAVNTTTQQGVWAGSLGVESGVDTRSRGGEFTLYEAANNAYRMVDMSTADVRGGTLTGSWPGNMNNWDTLDLATTTMLSGNTGVLTGSWPGNMNHWDLYHLPQEDHNKSVITADNPMQNQGVALVEWNFFPLPPPEPELETRDRDLTRFQKTYSFTRHQPVRIRVFRR